MKITKEEKQKIVNYLLKLGERPEDIPQVFEGRKVAKFYYNKTNEITDKKISCEEAFKLLGFEKFWNGLDRASYHWNCVREINEQEYIYIDCSNLFKHLFERR